MVATARLLASPTAGVTDDMVIDREQGLVDEVAGRVRDLVEAEPDDVDQRIFEVEALAAAGQDDAAAERLRELERLAPADPDVVGWRQTLESTSSAASSPDEAVDVNELAQNLFGGSDLSFETRSKFNQRYADSSIRWQGRVKGVSETGEGWQAVITVAIVSNDLYGNTDIDVVVENPAGPRPSEGQTVVISGKLTRIDPLMRNLFITEGSLS
jgi:sensor domain CHASE-containing protein